MANNFQQTAFTFKLGSAAQVRQVVMWLSGNALPPELRQAMFEQSPDCFTATGDLFYTIVSDAEATEDPTALYVGVDEGDLELLVTILSHAMERWPDVPSPQGFEWASWCDKARIGEFSGGAVVIKRGEDNVWFSTSEFLRQQQVVS